MGPELVEVVAQRCEACWIELVEPAIPGRAVRDEVCVLEDTEVLRDRRSADGEPPCEIADRERSIDQAEEDGSPGGFAEGVELRVLVSHGLR